MLPWIVEFLSSFIHRFQEKNTRHFNKIHINHPVQCHHLAHSGTVFYSNYSVEFLWFLQLNQQIVYTSRGGCSGTGSGWIPAGVSLTFRKLRASRGQRLRHGATLRFNLNCALPTIYIFHVSGWKHLWAYSGRRINFIVKKIKLNLS